MSTIFFEGFEFWDNTDQLNNIYSNARLNSSKRGAQTVIEPSSGRFGGAAWIMKWFTEDYFDDGMSNYVSFLNTQQDVKFAMGISIDDPNREFIRVTDDNGSTIFALDTKVEDDNTRYLVIRDLPNDSDIFAVHPFEWQIWHWLEVELTFGSPGTLTMYTSNGEQIYSGSHDFSLNSNTGFDRLEFHTRQLDIDVNKDQVKLDLLVVWTDDGVELSYFPIGDCRVIPLRPNADGSQINFTSKSGGPNYEEVNDSPGYDGDTTYNSSSTKGDQDLFKFETIPTDLNLGNIVAVASHNIVRKDTDNTREVAGVVRSGNTIDVGDNLTLSQSYNLKKTVWAKNPDTNSSWTRSEVNSIEAGYKVTV